GTFHPVGDPTQSANWSLLFLPGPNPGATLSLSVDHGCGGGYLVGAPLVITYRASMNDRLTLMIRRSDGSQSVLFANLPVTGGALAERSSKGRLVSTESRCLVPYGPIYYTDHPPDPRSRPRHRDRAHDRCGAGAALRLPRRTKAVLPPAAWPGGRSADDL